MRVIRTELYFDGGNVLRGQDRRRLRTTNVSFVWLKQIDFEGIIYGHSVEADVVPFVIDYIVRQEPPDWMITPSAPSAAPSTHARVLNPWLVEQVLNSEIVIEQSPPDWETLGSILKSGVKGSGTVALSVYVAISGDVMLFVTLPSALLLIGAAKGTAKWLEQTVPKMLNKATRRWR
jgi:hypothetical protein